MQTILSIQHWLYSGMSEGLGAFVWGDPRAVLLAMGAVILFGAVHALMPGHGKTVLVSYHLGQEARPFQGFLNGAILAITHVGLAVVIVLAGFAVISRAFAYGGRTPQFEFASGVLVVLIGAFLLWRSLKHRHQAAPANGKALALVAGMVPCPLTTFILSYALARGVLTAGLAVTAAMTVGMIATIGGIALLAAFARGRFMALLARTETLRHRVGMGLEIGGALAVLGFGLVLIARA